MGMYLANSPLVSQITFKQSTATRMTTTKQSDNLNRLTQVSSASPVPSVANFSYSYNSANQRTNAALADGSYWVYGYDSLGQVTSGNKYWSDGSPVAGQQFGYGFDDIGNRNTASAGGDSMGQNLHTADYTNNSLNQITSRSVPGYVPMIGSAASNATVTLWGDNGSYARTSRKGQYFSGEAPATNTSAAVWLTVTNLAVLQNGTNADTVSSTVGRVFLPETPEQFTYDADGNLATDGRWTYGRDAENRLVSLTPSTAVGPQESLRFEYDWKGRRIHKQVWPNATWSDDPTNDVKFVSDGWNLLAELNATNNAVIRSYLWGSDLSGTMQGAGGVGGLLEVWNAESGERSFVGYDGNGNISALVDAGDGTLSAQYEDGPFGELLRATGPMAKVNPFRFSTKYQDDETDLVYYGLRWYSPTTGKWLSRDPIMERGGANLYAFVANDALMGYDAVGTLRSGQLIPVSYQGKSLGFVAVIYYSPLPILLYNNRSWDTRVGAQVRLAPQLECDCCCFKWRQYLTVREDDHYAAVSPGEDPWEYLPKSVTELRNVLDVDWKNPFNSEWYPRLADEPDNGCSYVFKDTPSQLPPPGMFYPSAGVVNRVAVSFRLQLVRVANCGVKSGGEVVLQVRWGFWYTKDANGLLNWN